MIKNQRIGLLLDVETTGLSPYQDEMIELALILFSYCQDTGEFIEELEHDSFLREPLSESSRNNYESAYKIHGIPFQEVEGKSFHDVKIKTYFHRADSIFAHNASFDRSFLYQMYPEINLLKWYCTMRNIEWKKYGYQNSKLITLLQAHQITNYQSHRAMDDITYLMQLLKKQNPQGNYYLKEVINKKPMNKYQPVKSKNKVNKQKSYYPFSSNPFSG
ncbi:exonuclease domain-containing protein [Bacillus sp. 03113]|uniref:exonuclease domain-containing protein n=1 Tax=Bacillus sp. 03113 TaxID=2578211 RepID=UPI00114123C4|nr:exonuclease domain-containing protein [Bacillus sp. 03113]